MFNHDTDNEYDLVSKCQPPVIDLRQYKISQRFKNVKASLTRCYWNRKTFTISNVVHKQINQFWYYHTTKPWRDNYTVNSKFSQIMLLSILFLTMITINLRRMFLHQTYIEKDSSINDEIDKLRNSATASLLARNDTIVVSSVSSIFGLVVQNNIMTMLLMSVLETF